MAEAESHQIIDHAKPLQTGSLVMIKDPATAATDVNITGTKRFLDHSITANSSDLPSAIS